MTSREIQPFRIDIPQSALDDLKARLDNTRWPDEVPGVGWALGAPRDYVEELAQYWRNGYDWRAHEAALNRFPQFTTEIDGQNVHFLHVRSANPGALPLIITHGWPGSVAEFVNVVEPLSENFHLVVPSIPGFGFSGPTRDTGWGVHRIARAWAELMSRLGYERYGAQGGDWGSAISRELGVIAPEHVVGVHLNFLLTFPTGDVELTEEERARLSGLKRFNNELSGYVAIQSTRPQTLSYALTDSPVGQLAWIVEKFKEWTDSKQVPEDAVDRDQMLTNVMIYWLTATAGSSARIYHDSAKSWGKAKHLGAPTALAVFPREIALPVRRLAELTNNITRWTEFDRGGHFAAMEEPDLLVEDVRAFFSGVR